MSTTPAIPRGIVDGAAAVLIGSKEIGERARADAARADPRHRQDRHRSDHHADRPGARHRKDPAESGMEIGDIDLFEVNEAFSAVVLRFMQAFDVDHAKVNVNGGAIAMGHPLGATGAMILGTLLDEMERSGKAPGWPRSASPRHGRGHDHREGLRNIRPISSGAASLRSNPIATGCGCGLTVAFGVALGSRRLFKIEHA
jgi:acetyl-CoA acetyltransferase